MSLAGIVTGATGAANSPDVVPGTVASWALQLYVDAPGGPTGKPLLTLGSDVYDGTVTATLPSDLAGGSYEVVVEGLTTDDVAKLRGVTAARLAAKLHLWWKDAPGFLGDLASFTGLTDGFGVSSAEPPASALVAVLRVERLIRRAGTRRYETVFTLKERVWARLGEAHVQGLCYDSLDAALHGVAEAAGVTITGHALETIAKTGDVSKFATTAPGTARDALRAKGALLDQIRDGLPVVGPKPALVRDGVLNVGRWTAMTGAVRILDTGHGLLSVQRAEEKEKEPAAEEKTAGASSTETRSTVVLVTLGRPDIKPGDTVSAPMPLEDFPDIPSSIGSALLTSMLGVVPGPLVATVANDPPSKRLLVTEVKHVISRRAGFATTIKAVVLADDADDGWDKRSATPKDGQQKAPERSALPADSATAVAQRIQDAVRAADVAHTRIAQIRRHAAGEEDPAHTSEVWFATAAPDGRPALAQRTQITAEQHGEAKEVPYATPFAWGPYGLALPRYPGMRVFLADAPGGHSDPVDLGAVWARGDGPPTKAGDYWLALPVGKADSADADSEPPEGDASHDLIDGDGVRVIETSRFVIRVTDRLTRTGDRPEPGDAPDGGVLIEARGSGSVAQITLAPDGAITITGSSITLDAGQGDITMKAGNVQVKVAGTMDVGS